MFTLVFKIEEAAARRWGGDGEGSGLFFWRNVLFCHKSLSIGDSFLKAGSLWPCVGHIVNAHIWGRCILGDGDKSDRALNEGMWIA